MRETNDKKTRYNFTLSDSAIKKLDEFREYLGMTRSGFLDFVLRNPDNFQFCKKGGKTQK